MTQAELAHLIGSPSREHLAEIEEKRRKKGRQNRFYSGGKPISENLENQIIVSSSIFSDLIQLFEYDD